MSTFQKPKKWNLKKGLTQVPDLWRNVLFAAPLWEGGGKAQDLVSGVLADVKFGGDYAIGPLGTGFNVTTNGQGMYWPVLPGGFDLNDMADGEYLTIQVVVDITDPDTSTYNRLIEVSGPGSFNYRWNIYNQAGEFQFWSNGGVEIEFESFLTFGISGLHNLIFVVKKGDEGGVVTDDQELYVNGEYASGSSDLGFYTASNPDITFGIAGGKDGIQSSVHGLYYSVVVWKNRKLNPEEVKFLHKDPFVMFRPAGF